TLDILNAMQERICPPIPDSLVGDFNLGMSEYSCTVTPATIGSHGCVCHERIDHKPSQPNKLGMVWLCVEIGVEQFGACGFLASAGWLCRNKNCVNGRKDCGIVKLEYPPVLLLVVLVKHPKALRGQSRRFLIAP